MELRLLKYFIAVAEELHFGRAASRLQMAQPPLSIQIKQLETEIGAKLFNRTKRNVELTEAGKVFLNRSYEILSSVNRASEEARRIHEGVIGELILGFGGSATFDLLPFILKEYRDKYPNVNIVLRQQTTTKQVNDLHEGKIHVGILVPPIESELLDVEILREEPFIVVLPKTHPLITSGLSINLSRLAGEPFIMSPRSVGPGYYDSVISSCYDAGFSPKIAQEAQEFHTIVSLVAFGLGVALVPKSIQFLKNENVIYMPLEKSYTKKTALAWNKNKTSPVVDSFIEFIRQLQIPNT
ncbi:LysR substrate-binding domain-containing protein [Ureibacillus sp. GCM10028918]|uniref:LysR family transcriptional regulator n=1 Tax=Ureibacillus sp. GCM10028918 TaxID=3273429 RepID=UPI00361A4E74